MQPTKKKERDQTGCMAALAIPAGTRRGNYKMRWGWFRLMEGKIRET
ncbi:hypothetical protein [Pontibacter virosus]|nr:hypothetical protein [Pontibacter virosus]